MSAEQWQQTGPSDPVSDSVAQFIKVMVILAVVSIALPLLIPVAASRLSGEAVATKTEFWVIGKRHWVFTAAGITAVALLVLIEAVLLWRWIADGDATALMRPAGWKSHLVGTFAPWAAANFASGLLLLPAAWSVKRRRIAELVRSRQVSDVVRQEKIEAARKRAADQTTARRMGVTVDRETGQITGTKDDATTVPDATSDGRRVFGFVNRITVRTIADRFFDIRRVRDWVDAKGEHIVLPKTASAVRALVIAESGTGKTVLLDDVVLCALTYGWPVLMVDAKGDPGDAEHLVVLARSHGIEAEIPGGWNLFNGTAEQITSLLMRLMPAPDGANQHYLDEIRGVLQAVQDQQPLRSIDDLRERLHNPGPWVRDRYDLQLVNQPIDRNGGTSGTRALQALAVALRPLEKHLDPDGWAFGAMPAQLTVVPISTSDDAQARLGDLLLFDLRNFLAARMQNRDRTPMLVVVDEFAQLVSGNQDPGDTAGSLFETARSAGVGLVLAAQSAAGLSNDETKRKRALGSGAALIFGRSKDPEEMVFYAGTAFRMEASGHATGGELGTARAQHSYVIHPQEVREAADGSFWLVQAGAIAPFRALPHRTIEVREATGVSEPVDVGDGADDASTEPAAQLPAS
jgi:hypothetical protein